MVIVLFNPRISTWFILIFSISVLMFHIWWDMNLILLHGFLSSVKHLYVFNNKYLFKKLFEREVLVSQKNWEENTDLFHISSAPTHAELLPLLTSPNRVVYLLQLMNLHLHIASSKVNVCINFWCSTLWFQININWHFYQYSIIHSIFTALKNLCTLPKINIFKKQNSHF